MNFTIEPGTCAKDINDLWKVFAFKLLEKMEKDIECSLDFKIVPAFPNSKSALYKIVVRKMSKYCFTQTHILHINSENQKNNSVYKNLILALADPTLKGWAFVFPYFYGYCTCSFKSIDIESCIISIDLDECEWIFHNENYY